MNKLSICGIASLFVAAMLLTAGSINYVDSLGDIEMVQRAPPLPVLPSAEELALFEIAKNVPGVKAWAADGWQYLGMDFLGTQKPAKWTHAIVNMKLPPTAEAQKYCSEGWGAMVMINLETMQVEDADFPSDANDQCGGPDFEFGG